MGVRLSVGAAVEDEALSRLHALAFGTPYGLQPFRSRLTAHSLTWVTAYADEDDRLVGFVNVAWDGGAHAFVVDTVVDPGHRNQGVGRALVRRAAREARAAGCEWLHVDFEDRLSAFYLDACGFSPTAAGVLPLGDRSL